MGIIRVYLEPQIAKVRVLEQGPAGPVGAQSYLHTQSTPATEWVINHNLGRNPGITLKTTGGLEFNAEVLDISVNQSRVYLVTAQSGFAYCI